MSTSVKAYSILDTTYSIALTAMGHLPGWIPISSSSKKWKAFFPSLNSMLYVCSVLPLKLQWLLLPQHIWDVWCKQVGQHNVGVNHCLLNFIHWFLHLQENIISYYLGNDICKNETLGTPYFLKYIHIHFKKCIYLFIFNSVWLILIVERKRIFKLSNEV